MNAYTIARKTICTCITSLLILSTLGQHAWAQDTEPREEPAADTPARDEPTPAIDPYAQATKRSKEAFGIGDYTTALTELKNAYAIRSNPNLLYNIAFIYEKQGNLPRAIEYYDKFLVAPDVDLTNRKAALERVKVLREIIAVRTPKPPEKTTQPDTKLRPKPTPTPWSTQKTLGAFVLGTGGAAILTGGILGSLAISEHTSMENATDVDTRRELAESTESLSFVSDVVLFSGIGLGVTGALLFILDSPEQDSSSANTRSTLSPLVLPSGAGLSFETGF